MWATVAEMEEKSLTRLKDKKALVVVFVMVFLISYEVYAFTIVYSEGKDSLPQNIGNFERIRNYLKKQGPQEKFSFAVVGDTCSRSTFERLCDELRNQPLSFIVILGDFVETSTKGNHDYFKFECRHKCNLPFPVFLVVGNHDVVWKENDYDLDSITIRDFERMYGPRNFSFEHNGCLFVGLCILPAPFPTSESIDFLKSALAGRCDENERVFVFTYMPMVTSAGPVPNSFENMQAFIEVIDRYKVDYVISSHYHGYDRTKRNNTVYLVTSGGGAPLDEKETFNSTCHAIVLTLDRESVSEKSILAPSGKSMANYLRLFAVAELAPYLKRHPALTVAENIFILIILLASIGKLIGEKRRLRLVSNGE